MKPNIESIKFISFSMAKKLGYADEETIEGLKQFFFEKYNINFYNKYI